MLKKIVVIGPECTGKSTLCSQLAAHYETLWVPEFAREYLIANGPRYTPNDLMNIARGQLAAEDLAVKNTDLAKTKLLFIDTDMYVMKVWSEIVFNACDNRILMQIAKRRYDLYLLCYPDLPWIEDELREYPSLDKRKAIFQFYKDAMVHQHVAWAEVRGNYNERFEGARSAILQCLEIQ